MFAFGNTDHVDWSEFPSYLINLFWIGESHEKIEPAGVTWAWRTWHQGEFDGWPEGDTSRWSCVHLMTSAATWSASANTVGRSRKDFRWERSPTCTLKLQLGRRVFFRQGQTSTCPKNFKLGDFLREIDHFWPELDHFWAELEHFHVCVRTFSCLS